jgi:transcriptional regulator with GAF, ATPase, and Fis domain
LLDLQYLQQEHEARACFMAPLMVADSSLGALSLAATQSDAFSG